MPPDEFDESVESAATSLLIKPAADAVAKTPDAARALTTTDIPRTPAEDDPDNQEDPDRPPPVEEPPVDEASTEEDDIDLDEIELDLSVDGEDKKVKIKDLKARYAGEGAIEKRLQEATEMRQGLEQQAHQAHQFLEAQKERLRQIDELVAQQQPQNIDWEALRVKDPGRYLLERDKAREIQERRRNLLSEHQRLQAQQDEIAANARIRFIQSEEMKLRKKVPELADPTKATEFNNRLMTAAQHYGYTNDEYNGVMDHRAMLVLRDAAAWREHQEKQKTVTKKEVVPKPLLKAGNNNSGRTQTTAARIALAATKKARETGKPDDVARTLLVRGRAR